MKKKRIYMKALDECNTEAINVIILIKKTLNKEKRKAKKRYRD